MIRELGIAKTSLQAITDIAKNYLKVNKSILPNDQIINHIYISISKINNTAISINEESIVNLVIKAHIEIIEILISVERNITLSFVTLAWLINTIEKAQSSNLDDVPFQASFLIAGSVSKNFPKDLVVDQIYSKIIDYYIDSSKYFLNKQSPLTSRIIDNMFIIPAHLIKQDYKNVVLLLSEMLVKIVYIIYLSLSYELINKTEFNLVESVYHNIYMLLCVAKREGPKELLRTNTSIILPYSLFLKISEEVSTFLLNTHNVDLTNSHLGFRFIESIKGSLNLFVDLFDRTIIDLDIAVIIKQIKRYIDSLINAFSNLNSNDYLEKMICDFLAYTAIRYIFVNEYSVEIIEYCVEKIFFIINQYTEPYDTYAESRIAERLIYIWYIQKAVEIRGIKELSNELGKRCYNFISQKSDELKVHFDKVKQDASKRINEGKFQFVIYSDKAEDLLIQYVNNKINFSK